MNHNEAADFLAKKLKSQGRDQAYIDARMLPFKINDLIGDFGKSDLVGNAAKILILLSVADVAIEIARVCDPVEYDKIIAKLKRIDSV